MFSWGLIRKLILPKPPPIPDSVWGEYEEIPHEGLTMGTLFIGMAGTGKTTSLALHLVDYIIRHPKRAVLVVDSSGSLSDDTLKYTSILPREIMENTLKRYVYDDMGNPEWVMTLPEFSPEYGTSFEEQVQRVKTNLLRLAPELVKGAPFLAGLSLQEIAPETFRLLTAIKNEQGENWQITEAKKILLDGALRSRALTHFGLDAPEAKWFFERVFNELSGHERELRTYALLSLLGVIEPKEIRARLGYHKPSWTPKEAIEKGLVVIVDGSRLINRESAQHYLFTQVFSLIMEQINKRTPHDPNDIPVTLVIDEVYSLLSIPGMASEIAKLAPQYRSRKLQLYIVLQQLAQMSPELRPHIWALGNMVCFRLSNFEDAYDMSQQLSRYQPQKIKMPPRSELGQPIVETDRGQYLTVANIIQDFKKRECIVRRYITESEPDPSLLYIAKTREAPDGNPHMSVDEIKEYLLKQRAVRVRDALEIVNQRNISGFRNKPPSK